MLKPTPAPTSDANCRTPSSALSSRESSRARSSPDPSSCGASSRSSSNNDWPGRAIRSRNRSSPTSLREGNGLRWRGRSRRSGGRQTPSRQTARVLRRPIRSRRHLAAEGQLRPVFEANSASPSHTAPPVVAPERSRRRRFQLQARQDRHRRCGARRCGYRRRARLARTPCRGALQHSCSPWLCTQVGRGRLRCPRTATSSPSPGRDTPRLARRISM